MDYEIMMNGSVKLRTNGTRNRSKFYNGRNIIKQLQRKMGSTLFTSPETLLQFVQPKLYHLQK